MDTNTNFSNSNAQMLDAGARPATDHHKEIIGQLPNPAVIPPATIVNSCRMESITKRRSRSDCLADNVSFANEQ